MIFKVLGLTDNFEVAKTPSAASTRHSVIQFLDMQYLIKLMIMCSIVLNDASTKSNRDRDCPVQVTWRKLGRCSRKLKRNWNRPRDNMDNNQNVIGQFIPPDFTYECGVDVDDDCPAYSRGKKTRNTHVVVRGNDINEYQEIRGEQKICHYTKHCRGPRDNALLEYDNYYEYDSHGNSNSFKDLYAMRKTAYIKGFNAGVDAVKNKYKSRLLRLNPLN